MDSEKALKTLNVRSVWIPVLIGLGVVITLILTDDRINAETFELIKEISPMAVFASLAVLLAKDFANMFRLKFMSNRSLKWMAVLRVIFLWEFAIAVTPPLLGATGVLVFIMYKEGLSFGKALAFTLLLATFDNLFFLTASPLAIWLSDGEVLPDSAVASEILGKGLKPLFWLSYSLIVGYTSFMLSAVLLFPSAIRRLTAYIMSFALLKKWKAPVLKQADDLVLVSKVLKEKPWHFWPGLLGISYLVWILKFSVLNAIMIGFVDMTIAQHSIALGRHLIMWVVMLVSPAPGNAGTAEFIFPVFFEDYLGDYTFITALLWRLLSYYPYLLLGALLIPRWLKRK